MGEAARIAPDNAWFQLYAAKDPDVTDALGGRARDNGLGALKSARPRPRPITEADIEWQRSRRVGRQMRKTDASTLVREMREDGEAFGR